jgi:uncharacterized membrane protein
VANDLPLRADSSATGVRARTRVLLSALAGVVTGAVVTVPASWPYGLMIGWMVAATVFLIWVWTTIWPMDAARTAAHAVREDPGRAGSDLIVLVAALASLGAVALLLTSSSAGGSKDLRALVSVAGVAFGWGAIHTVFTVRYANLYYSGGDGGIDFNSAEKPRYSDFAYLAFTLGMTYQVSDTDLSSRDIRRMVLRHSLLSYLFGTVIIAAMINLVAGLAK